MVNSGDETSIVFSLEHKTVVLVDIAWSLMSLNAFAKRKCMIIDF